MPEARQTFDVYVKYEGPAGEPGFADACFVMVYPELNTACSRATDAYKGCLRSSDWAASLRTVGVGPGLTER